MADEVFEATARDGSAVRITLSSTRWGLKRRTPKMVVRIANEQWSPRWGSQEFDDWLDWMGEQRAGKEPPVPFDDDSLDPAGWPKGQHRPRPPLR